jgi:hypothetical protein
LSWTLNTGDWFALTVSIDGQAEQGVTGGVGSGSSSANWIQPSRSYVFRLRPALPPDGRADLSKLWAEKTVTARYAVNQVRGGSNYFYYRVDCAGGLSNCWVPFRVLGNYHLPGVRDTVKGQLASMYVNGQRRLRTQVPHCAGSLCFDNGNPVIWRYENWVDGRRSLLHPTFVQNIKNFLSDVKSAGYQEIVLGMWFERDADPKNWTCSNGTDSGGSSCSVNVDDLFSVVSDVRSAAVATAMPYKIDLLNEAVRTSSEFSANREGRNLKYFVSALWPKYRTAFGTADTVGFSVALDHGNQNVRDRLDGMKTALGGVAQLPALLSFHIYGDNVVSARDLLASAASWLSDNGIAQKDVIIGEAWYNHAESAASFRDAINATGIDVKYLLQWPIEPYDTPQEWDRDPVAPPFSFSSYQASGF